MSKYRILIRVLVVISLVSIILLLILRGKTYPERIILQGKVYKIETVDTAPLMAKGLSKYTSLKDDEGMLFVFSKSGEHTFWMKDMQFSIDIIWFNQDRRVVHIEKSLSPTTYPNSYGAGIESLYVLEVAAGQVDKIKLKIGDRFDFVENNGRKLGI